jgi:hypothetical protein
MDKSLATITALLLMWIVFSLAGLSFLRNAIFEQAPKKSTKVGMVVREVRFRARLFAGLAMLLWVAASLVWVLIKWL